LRKWQQLAIILVFILLLTAGLDYTGRNMYHALGGGRKYYAFLLPDPGDSQVVFCGRSYAEYQVEDLWDSRKAALQDLLPASPVDWLKKVFHTLEGRRRL
jgi:CO dehydrogenase/acetyl-CoA synthase delta subunit